MGLHITRYKRENGKIRKAGGKAADPAAKPAGKDGASGSNAGANNNQPKQGV